MKHTAGPWTVSGHHVDNGRIQIGSQKDYICELYWEPNDEISKAANWTEAEANANLIAAAPDMYEALIEIEQFLTSYEIFDRNGKNMYEDISGTFEIIEAAIAKAEGN